MHIWPSDGQQSSGSHGFRWAAECLEIQQVIYKSGRSSLKYRKSNILLMKSANYLSKQ